MTNKNLLSTFVAAYQQMGIRSAPDKPKCIAIAKILPEHNLLEGNADTQKG